MNSDRTRSVADRKALGAHYTPSALASFVAESILDSSDLDAFRDLRILDPACGDGSLIEAIGRSLTSRGLSSSQIVGYDTSADALRVAESRLDSLELSGRVRLVNADFLATVRVPGSQESLFAESAKSSAAVDLLIANPPYVRTQVLGAQRAQQLSSDFGLSGRVDLYFAFVRAIAEVLRPGGVAGLIVSNRFMSTQAGAGLRAAILEHFDVLSVTDFGDTRLFEAAVLPAVLVLRKKSAEKPEKAQAKFTSIYTTDRTPEARTVSSVFEALAQGGLFRLASGETYIVSTGHLDTGAEAGSVWRLATDENDRWLSSILRRRKLTFGDIGPLRVGVKTTADKVFIKSDWESVGADDVPELLRPLTTHHTARQFRARETDSALRILYPHENRDGRRKPVDLRQYPKTARYLESHRATLEGRTYVRDAGREWFELWVPQDPDGWSAPKLVWRDISEKPTFWFDRLGSVVNGDCYWLSAEAGYDDLLWLALAVANSRFTVKYYDSCFNNRLYAGRRRFITQYVRQFPLPDPATGTAQQLVALSRRAYEVAGLPEAASLLSEIDELTFEAFGSPVEKGSRKRDLELLV